MTEVSLIGVNVTETGLISLINSSQEYTVPTAATHKYLIFIALVQGLATGMLRHTGIPWADFRYVVKKNDLMVSLKCLYSDFLKFLEQRPSF